MDVGKAAGFGEGVKFVARKPVMHIGIIAVVVETAVFGVQIGNA